MGNLSESIIALLAGFAPVADWPWVEVAEIVAFILLSAFFSAAETALTALGEARAQQLSEQGKVGFGFLKTWIDRPEQVMATLLLGNTLCNIAAATFAAEILQRYVTHAAAIATGVMTFVLLYVSEISPKTFAKAHAEWTAHRILPLTAVFYWVLFPIGYPLFQLTVRTNRLLASNRGATPSPTVTSEDVDYVINLGTREGVLDKVKEELLNSVLEFGDIVVKEIMTPRTNVVAIDRDSPLAEVLTEVGKAEFSRLPVYQGTIDNVVGVLYTQAVLADLQKPGIDPTKLRLEKYTRSPFFVPEGMKISRLLKEFQRRRLHLAVVVDEFGGTSGVISLEDVIEELVGEIQDEGEAAEEGPMKVISDGVILAEGATPLRDLAEVLKIEFPDTGDYETLGGFLTAQAGRVPAVGAVLLFANHTFIVRIGDERRVGRVEIRRNKPDSTTRPPPPRSTPSQPPGQPQRTRL